MDDLNSGAIPFVSAAEVERLLDLNELIPAMEEALIDLSLGRVVQPVRMVVPAARPDSWFALMPAVYKDVLGAKLVTVFPENAALGLHTHHAVIQLFRAATGEPLAIVDGRVVTAWRTAAVSALATRELSPRDARVLAILGSGVQASTHLAALKKVREFEEVRVWSRTAAHAARFARQTGAKLVDLESAVRGADVIVTATNSSEPFLRGEWLKEGAHVNAVGAVGPRHRELDDDCLRSAAVIVESRESAVRESAEITQSSAPIYAELGELLARVKPPPQAGVTVYKSLGVAVEDIAAARLIHAKSLGSNTN